MTTPIKPRVDDDGVPRCGRRECASYHYMSATCLISGGDCDEDERICAPAVRDLAAEVAAARAHYEEHYVERLQIARNRTDAWRPK